MTVTRTRTVPQMTRSRGHPGEEDDGAGGRGLAEREQSGERLFDAHAPLTSRSAHITFTFHMHCCHQSSQFFYGSGCHISSAGYVALLIYASLKFGC